jgi:alkylation response protein AidB-like acyl-CoA dehydrogenase
MLLAEVKRSVDDALALVAERVGDTEARRRLPDDVVAALRRTGLYRLLLPAAMEGL